MKRAIHPTLLAELLTLRLALHQTPELAHEELRTAETVARFLSRCGAGNLRAGVGGRGLLAVFAGTAEGPTVLLRCELDGLPIAERDDAPHASRNPGISHKCGHDGHMAIAAGVGALLVESPLRRGRVVLLFQPAEETGEGMELVLADPALAAVMPDVAFAVHNLPGFPLGQVILRSGAFAFGSVGLVAELEGATSHAAHPEGGRSPARALGRLLLDLPALPVTPRGARAEGPDVSMGIVTPIHARLGASAFGTAPGEATLMATLRAPSQEALDALRARVEARVHSESERDGLRVESRTVEPFPPTTNHPWCVRQVRAAATACGLDVHDLHVPFKWSEDFGHLARRVPAALVGMGAGEGCAQLHHPDYGFPDALLEPGIRLLVALLEGILDREPAPEVPCMPPR